MKPDSFLESDEINIQFEKSSKKQMIIPDEQANGVYGLVITGHSLVRKVRALLEMSSLKNLLQDILEI